MRSPRLSVHAWWLAAAAVMAGAALLWALPPAPVGAWVQLVVEVQRELHRDLAGALALVRDEGARAAWPLLALSFAYGVFHAAGPGHGKVVVTAYLGTHESRLRRGLALTTAAALAQAVTAIVAVHVLSVVLGQTLRAARAGADRLELVSFALVVVLGAYLAGRALRRLARGHDGDTAPACATCTVHRAAPGVGSAAAVVAAVGLRPCAGAVIVLLLAYAGGVPLVGMAATLAMAAGTALTTGVLALLAVSARRTAAQLAAALPVGHGRLARIGDGIALAGGVLLLATGALLLSTALATPTHPFR